MTVPLTRSVGQFRTEDSTDPGWLSGWLRLVPTGASIALSPALAVAQIPTVPEAAAPHDDGQWTMPAKNYAATRYSTLDEISGANVKNLQVAFAFSTGV